jgi:excisionase family DNA binding protein
MTQEQNGLTTRQAAKYMGISEGVLRLWRSLGKGPIFFKAGEKLVRYRRSDLDSWIESRLTGPGTPVAAAR